MFSDLEILSTSTHSTLFSSLVSAIFNTSSTTFTGVIFISSLTFFGISTKSFSLSLGIKDFNCETDCVMMCGSLDFNNELKEILLSKSFIEGATNRPGTFVLEKAFVG